MRPDVLAQGVIEFAGFVPERGVAQALGEGGGIDNVREEDDGCALRNRLGLRNGLVAFA